EAWRVDAEQDRAVLEEAPAAPPLGAADDLAPVDINLVAPGPREAERGRRDSAARDRDHLDGRAERPKPGDQGAPDPPIGLEQVARTAERSEEHTSELQSLAYLVCRLLLEKKKIMKTHPHTDPPISHHIY